MRYGVLLVLLMVVACVPTNSTEDWSVTIYDHGINALIELSPDSQQITPLSNMDYLPPLIENYHYPTRSYVNMTDNSHYIVSLVQFEEPYIQLQIYSFRKRTQ